MGVKRVISKGRQRIVRFLRGQGTAVATTLCVGVITAAALWYPQVREEDVSPAPTDDRAAAQLLQQTLPPVTPVPSASPAPFVPPLSVLQVVQSFDLQTMARSSTTGVWRVQDAATLAGQPWEAVRTMADGTVQACTADAAGGWRILLTHGDGLTAEYAGLAEATLSAGETVRAGDIIGRLGTGATPLLSLRVTRNGQPVDPLSLFSAE